MRFVAAKEVTLYMFTIIYKQKCLCCLHVKRTLGKYFKNSKVLDMDKLFHYFVANYIEKKVKNKNLQ